MKTDTQMLLPLLLLCATNMNAQGRQREYTPSPVKGTPWNAPSNMNPFIPGYFADPTIRQFGDTYYLYATKIHPTQKPVNLLKRLIEIYTDPGDVVIDPCAGSGSTLRAAYECGRNSYGFEVDRKFYGLAKEKMLNLAEEKQLKMEGA